ncbi:MAG: response regulator [Desulfuromonadales bacterium]|nr:response regulator [Desulfuromonadales bacterium]NIR34135.1 response regulator [Desulfuromonadales bacterium]NIS40218.1 response regulator [Desulfuromonadales bacterium]
MMNGRVLIVDHDRRRRQHLKDLLLGQDIESAEAASCEEALKRLNDEPVRLILTETELPTKSGLYLLRKVKERHPDLEVVLITHNASSYNLLQALRLGAYDFIVRPIDSGDILFNAVERAFRQSEKRLRTSRQVEELEHKNRSLLDALKTMKALNAATEHLLEAGNIEDLLMTLLTTALETTGADRGFIALFDRGTGHLGIKVSKGIPQSISLNWAESIPPGLIVNMAGRGKPVLVAGAIPPHVLERCKQQERELLRQGSGLLGAPLRVGNRNAGIVVLSGQSGRQPFDDATKNFLVQLSHHASLVLQKAGTIYRLQRTAQHPADGE